MKKTRKFIVGLLVVLCSFVMLLCCSGCDLNGWLGNNSSSSHTHEWIEVVEKQKENRNIFFIGVNANVVLRKIIFQIPKGIIIKL